MKTKTSQLKDLIKLCEFTYVNENIEKLFKTEKIRGEVEIKNFEQTMTSEEVIAELKKNGCLPANATELYHWVSQNKKHFKGEYRGVIALGSVADFEGKRRVPDSWWHESERYADLLWFGDGWYDYCWFAFVRESSALTSLESSKSFDLSPSEFITKSEFDAFKKRLVEAIGPLLN